ncbi:MAG: hypothetical protein LIO96_08000 [Lachnospiraceae bacterium]|nr:hypothetical protein [Lachnospiraceae bacterium]
MDNYAPNSHKSKEEKKLPEKKINKAISGKAKTKKKGEMRKLAEVFVPEDTESVKSYIFEDVFVPAVKDILLDTVKALLGVGDSGSSRKRTGASRVSYQKYYDGRDRREERSSRRRVGYDYDDVILETRADAVEVLDGLDEAIDVYGVVSVADLYDLAGLEHNYTDNKYGWDDIRSASIVRLRNNEYMIKMPKAKPID